MYELRNDVGVEGTVVEAGKGDLRELSTDVVSIAEWVDAVLEEPEEPVSDGWRMSTEFVRRDRMVAG